VWTPDDRHGQLDCAVLRRDDNLETRAGEHVVDQAAEVPLALQQRNQLLGSLRVCADVVNARDGSLLRGVDALLGGLGRLLGGKQRLDSTQAPGWFAGKGISDE